MRGTTTAVTPMRTIPTTLIGVRVPDPMRADPFHDPPISPPVCRPRVHVMVRRMMDHTPAPCARARGVDGAEPLPDPGGVRAAHRGA